MMAALIATKGAEKEYPTMTERGCRPEPEPEVTEVMMQFKPPAALMINAHSVRASNVPKVALE
jgi:hypothetical protein